MTFLFKCRNCGKIDKNPRIGDASEGAHTTALIILCDAMNNTPKQIQAPTRWSLHSCGDKITGIADLIGCAPD